MGLAELRRDCQGAISALWCGSRLSAPSRSQLGVPMHGRMIEHYPMNKTSRQNVVVQHDTTETGRWGGTTHLLVLLLVFATAALLRFEGLGVRSLWRDEICTWHVSQMPLAESLRWGPELTQLPLYQVVLRAFFRQGHPSEAELRMPAAVCGLGVVVAGCWLGGLFGSKAAAIALAGALAFQPLQVYYSREARSYSMLVLTCVLAAVFWFRLVRFGGRRNLAGYIVCATLALYSHYLAFLAIVSHFVWWLIVSSVSSRKPFDFRPIIGLLVTGVLCVPLLVRYLAFRSSIFQGLDWIAPPTLRDSLRTLSELTFGWHWVILVMPVALLIWIASAYVLHRRQPPNWLRGVFRGRDDPCGLLLLWLGFSWFGLMVISWIGHPALVTRYALPAAIPALLLPILVADRIHPAFAIILASLVIAIARPQWSQRVYDPGFREMTAYLQEHVVPDKELVVLTMDASIHPGWEDSERIAFDYYPLDGIELNELRLGPDGISVQNDVLKDPRSMYMIVFWADPFPVLKAQGREPLPIRVDGREYSQLSFPPYRLVHVAALTP